MVYITGSMHGDIECFHDGRLKHLKKGDTLIAVGNFGFLWNGGKKEQSTLKWIGKRKYQVLFVEGWYENYDELEQHEVVDFAGGKARLISGNLMQRMRGNVYHIEGHSIFTFGGGESPDREDRVEAGTWYEHELPTADELNFVLDNLEAEHNQVDYILTHEAPWNIKRFLDLDESDKNVLQFYFDQLEAHIHYRHWFCSSLMRDKVIPPQYTCIYRHVIRLGEELK